MTTALFGGAVLASFLSGMVALFAPCCISVMLPAYFASSFATKRALVAMTLVFAVGIGFVILPIALGAAAVGAFTGAHHFAVYLAGGAFMLALGIYMLVGGKLALPMPGMRARRGRGPLAIFSLGVFSGLASSCCAPVLAGVAALAGVSGSYSAAVTLGVAYVFGMVFPLFLIALLWDQFEWGQSRLLHGRTFHVHILGRARAISTAALASGVILVATGVVVIRVAFRGNAMPSSGWQLALSAHLQHYAHLASVWANTFPGWVTGILLVAAFAAFVVRALRQALASPKRRPSVESQTQISSTFRHQEEPQ